MHYWYEYNLVQPLYKTVERFLKKLKIELLHDSTIPLLGIMQSEVLVAQPHRTLCSPTDCSPPGSSVRGISRARILERVGIPFPRGSSQPRSLALQADSLPSEPPWKPHIPKGNEITISQRYLPEPPSSQQHSYNS